MGLLDSTVLTGIFTVTIPALATLYAAKKGNKRTDYIDKYIRELKEENEELKKKVLK